MWVEVDLVTFGVSPGGGCRTRALGAKTLVVSPSLADLGNAGQLSDSEYGQAIEVDSELRTVEFGRDYLGHFPLLYACTESALFISDDFDLLARAMRASGARLTISREAVALYFSFGYVPAGMTIYKEIVMCEGHTLYRWRGGKIEKISTFRPIEIDSGCTIQDLGRAISREVDRWAASAAEIDVWCSGGLDSSIMACAFNSEGRHAELLTVGYGRDIHSILGEGERPYAFDVAAQCQAPIREIELTAENFEKAHERFVATHPFPVVDTCVPPKYALALASRRFVITGEGSDPLFGGPKNNAMVFAEATDSPENLGRHYANAHNRWFPLLGRLMRHGSELSDYVVDYMNGLLGRYPGDLIRRLFYINTHVKAASLIFTESYYACGSLGISVRHPYAGLGVYRAAFALEDRFKYKYPKSKVALQELYANQLPSSVVNRRKSGTVMPLGFYLRNFASRKFDFSPLFESGLFKERFIHRIMRDWEHNRKNRPPYGLVTLSEWLKRAAAVGEADERAPVDARASATVP